MRNTHWETYIHIYIEKTKKDPDSYLHDMPLLLIQEPRVACTKHTAKKAIKYWRQILTAENCILCRGPQFIIVLKKQNKIQAFWPKHNPREDTLIPQTLLPIC